MHVQAIVRKYIEAFSTRNADECAACFAADGTYSDPGTSGPLRPDAIREHFHLLFEAFPDATTETVGLNPIAQDVAVWRWVVRGTNTAAFRGAPATGKTIALNGCEFIESRSGLIHRVEGYYDRLGFMAQLGLLPVLR